VLATNGTTYDKNTHVLRGVALSQAAMPDDKISFQYRPDDVNANGNVQTAGGSLFTTFLLPFEITSLLLLVAAIGAVYLTRRPPADR
jgi:NADH:ubiquinone oxidoreductase subunit 6 (subunit J)